MSAHYDSTNDWDDETAIDQGNIPSSRDMDSADD